jgi:hypothetical protein
MNAATCLRMRGTPCECEYAPMEPMSASSSCARSIASGGKALAAEWMSSGYSVSAATLITARESSSNDAA